MAGGVETARRAMNAPLALRLVYYTTVLATTIGTYLWTRSGGLQLLAFLLFSVVIVPVLDRFVMPGAAAAAALEGADYKPSRRVFVTWLLFSVAWLLVATLLLPDPGLGPVVGILVVVIPTIEIYYWLGDRDRRLTQAKSIAPN